MDLLAVLLVAGYIVCPSLAAWFALKALVESDRTLRDDDD